MWRTASGILSFVSFHGYRLTCAFGARCTVSIATAYGCPGTSSGRTRIGVCVGVPWRVNFQGPRGLAALGVAQIGRDHAELALELVERVERVGREARDRGVQPAAGDDQQREAGTDLLIVDADVALLIQWHGRLSLHSVVFRVRSHIAQTREPLECSAR